MHPTGLLAAALVLAPALSAQDTLYGSEVFLDDLGSIDRTTGAWTTIGSQGISGSITGLAFDPVGGVLYGCSPSNNSLYTLDRSTGFATLVGPTGFSNINGLAFDTSTNTLYCTDLNNNALFTVDVATGSGTLVAVMSNTTSVEGLAYDPATDTLYGLDDTAERIVILDRSTGAAQPLPNPIGVSGLWRGLTWDASLGVLWATRVNPGQLYSVDPATGIGTLAGSTLTFVQGLAFEQRGFALPFGQTCSGTFGPVALSATGPFQVGATVTTTSTNHAPNSIGLVVLGLSNTVSAGVALPLLLDPFFGTNGCFANVSLDASLVGLTDGNTPAGLTFGLPLSASFAGQRFYAQHVCVEPVPGNLSWSNGLLLQIQ